MASIFLHKSPELGCSESDAKKYEGFQAFYGFFLSLGRVAEHEMVFSNGPAVIYDGSLDVRVSAKLVSKFPHRNLLVTTELILRRIPP